MGNLGGYQRITTVTKNLGGPAKAVVIVGSVVATGEDGSGLRLSAGDEYRVMERDGDSVQIEVLSGVDNPYFVSAEFLRLVSGFPAEDADSGR